jgi:hypothetical protein
MEYAGNESFNAKPHGGKVTAFNAEDNPHHSHKEM